jgi:hypothetical protein
LVGYAYQQLTADSGAGATLGDFKSRVFAIGPQIGYLFPVGDMQGYLNLKGYKEFGAQNTARKVGTCGLRWRFLRPSAQKRPQRDAWSRNNRMSALGSKADISHRMRHVRFTCPS